MSNNASVINTLDIHVIGAISYRNKYSLIKVTIEYYVQFLLSSLHIHDFQSYSQHSEVEFGARETRVEQVVLDDPQQILP